MISAFMLTTIIYFINTMFSWLPEVTELPTVFGVDLDYSFGYVTGILTGLRQALPPFDILMVALFWYYGILLALLTWSFVRWVIGLIRGSGS